MLIFTATAKVPVPCQGSTRKSAWKRWCWEDLISVNIWSSCVDWRTAGLYLPECKSLRGFGNNPWAREMVQLPPCSHPSCAAVGSQAGCTFTQGTYLSVVSQRESEGCEEHKGVLHVPSGSEVRLLRVPTWAVSGMGRACRVVLMLLWDCILKAGEMFLWPALRWQNYCWCGQQQRFCCCSKVYWRFRPEWKSALHMIALIVGSVYCLQGEKVCCGNPSCPGNLEELEGTYLPKRTNSNIWRQPFFFFFPLTLRSTSKDFHVCKLSFS